MRTKIFGVIVAVTASLLVLGCHEATRPTPGSPPPPSPNFVSPNMIYVPPGRFQRDATSTNISEITQAYRISEHEITRDQFLAVMGADPSDPARSTGTNNPVQRVNWYHAIAFCNKLSLLEGLEPVYSVTVSGTPVNWSTLIFDDIPTTDNADWNVAEATWTNNGYRLPTEMEWMWAAMGAPADGRDGGTNITGYLKAFAGSDGKILIGDYAWTMENSGLTTHPVGTKLPNELGLFDMSGNVWEWCWDEQARYPSGTLTDHRGVSLSSFRVVRGGGWDYDAASCAVAVRGGGISNIQVGTLGFRVVRL